MFRAIIYLFQTHNNKTIAIDRTQISKNKMSGGLRSKLQLTINVKGISSEIVRKLKWLKQIFKST